MDCREQSLPCSRAHPCARVAVDDGCHEVGIIIAIARRAGQTPLPIFNREESLMLYPTQIPISGPPEVLAPSFAGEL